MDSIKLHGSHVALFLAVLITIAAAMTELVAR